MTHAPDDYAVVIGIDHYPNWASGAKTLKGPSTDAADFRDWLVDPDGGGLAPEHVRLIVSAELPPGPLHHAIDDSLREIRGMSRGKTRRRFYFYFGGHGHVPAMMQAQALCLANWSLEDQRAALDLDSYRKTIAGCMEFEETLFFLDCCRLRLAVPPGKPTELECADPKLAGRQLATLFGTEPHGASFEGVVGEDIRGYFTAALLQILRSQTIELRELEERLRTAVPQTAHPKRQVSRTTIETDRDILLGPPWRVATTPGEPAVVDRGTPLEVSLATNLDPTHAPAGEETPPPAPGEITVLRNGQVLATAMGQLSVPLPAGRYEVRVAHGEAVASYPVDHHGAEVHTLQLPRRLSAAPLSNTVDKHEWITDPVVERSRWDAAPGEQAVFIVHRPHIEGTLTLLAEPRLNFTESHSLHRVQPGTWPLLYTGPGGSSLLPVPVAPGWDTQIFLLAHDGRPMLETASILMRPAGAGFDPGDALLDAYERAVADLATGGPGPDPDTLMNLLRGKWHNPLFGLAGAHFLVRRMRLARETDPADTGMLDTVIHNLGRLMGARSTDVAALRTLRALLRGTRPPLGGRSLPPLFRAGLDGIIEASALRPELEMGWLEGVALGLLPGSPWSCWADADPGFADGDSLRFLARFEAGAPAIPGEGIVPFPEPQRVPDWLVELAGEERARAERQGRPVDLVALTRQARLPRSLVQAALEL
ncbi:MAG TPA: caspase family protein [Allosphingosinicella sp.]